MQRFAVLWDCAEDLRADLSASSDPEDQIEVEALARMLRAFEDALSIRRALLRKAPTANRARRLVVKNSL